MALSALAMLLTMTACDDPIQANMDNATLNKKKSKLGELFYNAKSLSANGKMSCATCHDTEHAMIDSRVDTNSIGASESTDGAKLGDRNAPTAAYAMFSPRFHFDSGEGLYIGGQFLDGREADLKGQAKGPFLNPAEMQMPDEASVVAVIEANTTLNTQLKSIYGDDIFNNTLKAYDAVADSIALFEMSPLFAPFNSKYDDYLASKVSLTDLEKEGLRLFSGKAMCTACHPALGENGAPPLFTDYSYDNLGTPANSALHAARSANGQDNPVDLGLGKTVSDVSLNGAFKVATLRNIALTGPYMHNGVFKDLKTVVHFYNTRDVVGAINPETNTTWEVSEVPETVNHVELGNLQLTNHEEDAIVAFLETLSDKKFK